MMNLLFKAAIGAVVVVLIALLAKTRNYYIAGLVPLFPTFALIAHYIVGSERSVDALKTTIVFSLWAILPYATYLASLYWLADRLQLVPALLSAALCWTLAAAVLILAWTRLHG